MTTNAVELQDINKQFPARRGEVPVLAVDNVNLSIEDGEFFSMLGPSGCGKTTTLRMIAGFEEPTSGKILLEGKDMVGIPPFHRPVNTVFQDYALFPHLNVQQNVAFGLEMEGKPRKLINERVKQVLDMVQLPNMERRTPRQLSGGQQQRVALARALIKEPRVLLLDEPLGALDHKLRKQMQLELKQMQRKLGITFVFVTHDQEEALTMSDRIAVMDAGHILQVGAPEEIYDRPVNRFVADFIGETNFLEGTMAEAGAAGTTGAVLVDKRWPVQGHLSGVASVNVNDPVTLAIRPEKVELRAVTDGSSPSSDPNMLPGRIEEKIFIGTDTRYIVRLDHGPSVVSRIQNDINHEQLPVGVVVSVYCSPQFALILTH